PEADPARIHDLHRRDLVLHDLVRRAPVALEGELHVVGGDRFAVVELDTLAQDELLDEAVLRQAPRFGQARRHGVAVQGLYQRVGARSLWESVAVPSCFVVCRASRVSRAKVRFRSSRTPKPSRPRRFVSSAILSPSWKALSPRWLVPVARTSPGSSGWMEVTH